MSSDEMRAHLEQLEDLLFGQDVPVGYKRLSKHCNLHVNQAKKLLPQYAEEKSPEDRVFATHLVSGKVATVDGDSGAGVGWHVSLVHKDQINDVKKLNFFESFSSHVYCLYQGVRSAKEILPECSTRLDDIDDKLAGIKNDKVAVREISRKKIVEPEPTKPAVVKKAVEKPKKEEKKPEPPAVKEKVEEESKKEDTSAKVNNKGGNNKNTNNNKKGGIANFFQRGATNGSAKTEAKPKPASKPEKVVEEVKDESEEEKPVEPKKQEKQTNGKAKAENGKVAPKRKQNKLQTNGGKKRKRILKVESDSSSDEDAEVEIEEAEICEPAPPTAVAKEEPAEESEGICRERKLVDKVFKDEKGFIVTKKTWVTSETRVEKDKDVIVEKVQAKKKEETAAAPAKKKQADIMSFFSKK